MESEGTVLSIFLMHKQGRWFLKKEREPGSFVQKYLFTCSPTEGIRVWICALRVLFIGGSEGTSPRLSF
jgi:hypothetical protein